ncbi:MAG: ABC transporter permease [Parvibaculaceae bacterium]
MEQTKALSGTSRARWRPSDLLSGFSPFTRYLLTRLVWSFAIVWVIVVINFLIIKMVPGDPVQALIGEFPAPPEYVAQIRKDFGLDQPMIVQLWSYIKELAQGNLGFSFANREPVLGLILTRAVNTLMLLLPALFLSAIIGVSLGLAAASRAGGLVDNAITGFTLFGYSIPVFWLAQVLVLIFAILVGVLPAAGMYSLRAPSAGWGAFKDLLWHMILPVVSIMAYKIATFARTSRASIVGVIRSDFVMTARAKGLSRRYILWRHVLPNAIIPVIAVFGYQFGHALTSSILVETVFAWPGMGYLFVSAIARRDFPVLQGVLLFSTIFVVVANLLTDIVYTLVDPRIRRSLGQRHE